MTCVFISGSRAINRLNSDIRQRLENLTSQGSCNNLKELLQQNKKALVYYSPEKQFFRVTSPQELNALLGRQSSGENLEQGVLAIS